MSDLITSYFNSDITGTRTLLSSIHGKDAEIINYVTEKKSQSKFTVIDIGASANSWTKDIADVTVDIKPNSQSKNHYTFDVQRESNWNSLMEYVEVNGKFDLSISTHTIEDLHYPQMVLDMLPKISKAGIISTPSLLREMGPGDRGQKSKGYDHHHWIYFLNESSEIVLVPKMNHIEHVNVLYSHTPETSESIFLWKDSVKYRHFWEKPHSTIYELYTNFFENLKFA